MTMPAFTHLLMEMMEQCTRLFRGTIEDGIVRPVRMDLEITRTLVWKCVSLLVSNILVGLHFLVLIWQLQRQL